MEADLSLARALVAAILARVEELALSERSFYGDLSGSTVHGIGLARRTIVETALEYLAAAQAQTPTVAETESAA